MNDDERNLQDLPEPEKELAQQLDQLGPLMSEQERAEAELDPQFTQNLRAHLVQGEELAPHPEFARTLRASLVGRRIRPLQKPSIRRIPRWQGIAAAATATAVLVFLILVALLTHTPSTNFKPPYPTKADIVFSYPAPGAVVHRLAPVISLIHTRPGIPFAGRLHLRAKKLPSGSLRLRAYKLAPPADAATLARLLDVDAHIRRVHSGGAVWSVAATGGFRSHRPLHSVAVSLATGEVIYHDRRNFVLPRSKRPLSQAQTVAVARRWLTRSGWPGRQMPVRSVGTLESTPKIRQVVFSWVGVGTAATEEATLWVTPNRSVVEAWLWPPVVQSGLIPARAVAAAWADVRHSALPLAVKGVSPYTRASGSGSVQHTSVVSILSQGGDRRVYLVPTYRFEGTVRIRGRVHAHPWYGLAPSASK
jgi:hypothetical protein